MVRKEKRKGIWVEVLSVEILMRLETGCAALYGDTSVIGGNGQNDLDLHPLIQ